MSFLYNFSAYLFGFIILKVLKSPDKSLGLVLDLIYTGQETTIQVLEKCCLGRVVKTKYG